MRWRSRAMLGGLVSAAMLAVGAGMALQPERAPGQPGRPPGERGQPRGDRAFENVHDAMRAINGGLRRLKASVADPAQKDQSLQALGRMQGAAVYAKGAKPGDHAPTPEKLLDYRRGQIKLITMLLECETALLDGNTDQVNAIIAKMEAFRDEMHKAFNVSDEDEGGGGG